MPGAMEDNKWELKYGQIAILERHTLGLGFKKKKNWIKKKTYQSKIQNQIEKEIPLSLARSLYIYIYTKHSKSISISLSVPISPSK